MLFYFVNIMIPFLFLSGGSSSVSDNFVRLNMKVKRFSRKSMRITGSKYKRQQWKQRQKWSNNRGGRGGRPSGRSNVCFKCGKPGHWARNCSETGGCTNLGVFNGEDVRYSNDQNGIFEEGEDHKALEQLKYMSPFPTVEEAAEMMRKNQRMESKEIKVDESGEMETNKMADEESDIDMIPVSVSSARSNPSSSCDSSVVKGKEERGYQTPSSSYQCVEPYLELQDGEVMNSKFIFMTIYFCS